jgi:hypothetical protein
MYFFICFINNKNATADERNFKSFKFTLYNWCYSLEIFCCSHTRNFTAYSIQRSLFDRFTCLGFCPDHIRVTFVCKCKYISKSLQNHLLFFTQQAEVGNSNCTVSKRVEIICELFNLSKPWILCFGLFQAMLQFQVHVYAF